MYQVLIVDDEPIVKIALRSMIDWESLSFHICATASNGEEALEMAERHHPDVIICDLKMPVMDGITLIKTAKERGLDCEFLVISNYEDFNYVRTALVLGAADYILKVSISPEELTAQLEKIKTRLAEKQDAAAKKSAENSVEASLLHQEQHAAWREFFTHKSYPLETLLSITGSHPDAVGPLALCEISFDWHLQQMETLPAPELIRNTLKNALEHFERRRILFFSSTNTLIVLPQSELEQHQTTIADLSSRIEQLFRYYMPSSPAILYQDNLSDLLEARRAYHYFQDLLDLTFYEALGQIHAPDLEISSTVPGVSYKDLVADLLSQPADSCLNYASAKISALLQECRQQHVMPSKLIFYFVRFLGELEYRLSDVSASSHDLITESADFIRNADTLDELEQHLTAVLSSVFSPSLSENSKNASYSAEILQAISYIQENYSKKISLAAVADHVGLSSGYLCRIFKEETGVSINAYINNLRMTRAGELLADKNSYIKEVAVSVGFEDQLYFSRLFKRYYGVTPSEYRLQQSSALK